MTSSFAISSRFRGSNGDAVSQRSVEQVIGWLATDKELRRHFREDARSTLKELVDRGLDLDELEFDSLASLDAQQVTGVARPIDSQM